MVAIITFMTDNPFRRNSIEDWWNWDWLTDQERDYNLMTDSSWEEPLYDRVYYGDRWSRYQGRRTWDFSSMGSTRDSFTFDPIGFYDSRERFQIVRFEWRNIYRSMLQNLQNLSIQPQQIHEELERRKFNLQNESTIHKKGQSLMVQYAVQTIGFDKEFINEFKEKIKSFAPSPSYFSNKSKKTFERSRKGRYRPNLILMHDQHEYYRKKKSQEQTYQKIKSEDKLGTNYKL